MFEAFMRMQEDKTQQQQQPRQRNAAPAMPQGVSGPFQPNYGNQFNIGELTVNMEGPSRFMAMEKGTDKGEEEEEEALKEHPYAKQRWRNNERFQRFPVKKRTFENSEEDSEEDSSGPNVSAYLVPLMKDEQEASVSERRMLEPSPLLDYLKEVFLGVRSQQRGSDSEAELEAQRVRNSPMIIKLTHDEN